MTATFRRSSFALLAVAGAILWVVALLADPSRAWRALLVNYTFFVSLAGGLFCWSAIMAASKASWMGDLEAIPNAAYGFALPSLALLLLLWYGAPAWAPWAVLNYHQGAWLSPGFLFGRDLSALALFWYCARRYLKGRGAGRGYTAAGILIAVYCTVFSLLGFDLVMALDPTWYSTLFGGYFFISALLIGSAAWTFLAVCGGKAKKSQLQDLGNLTMAFAILTAAMLFAQLLTIWYENLPAETSFLVTRMNLHPWKGVSVALLALVYLGPLPMLLTRWSKRTRWVLATVALLILSGLWLERLWLVAATFRLDLRIGLAELSLVVGFIGLCGLSFSFDLPGGRAEKAGEEGA